MYRLIDVFLEDKCYLECEKKEFKISSFGNHPMKLWNNMEGINKNISLLEMSFASTIYQKRSQVKLLQTVDVLSRIGGNTSLFFGFSCVTLMETFIFLFKSVVQLFAYQQPPESPPPNPPPPTVIYTQKLKRKSTLSVTMFRGKVSVVESYSDTDTGPIKRRKRPISLCPMGDTISEKDEADGSLPATPKRYAIFPFFILSLTILEDPCLFTLKKRRIL